MDTDLKVLNSGRTRIERASAEEVSQAKLAIRYGFHLTPFGEAIIGVAEKGICALAFLSGESREAALGRLSRDWSTARLLPDQAGTARILEDVFAGPAAAELGVYLHGTDFQLKVWQALLAIPPGEVTTYERLAQRIGDPTALRAVGAAIGRNPVAYLIPCHRVIRKSGALGGYRWGVDRKRAILAWEGQASPRLSRRARSQET